MISNVKSLFDYTFKTEKISENTTRNARVVLTNFDVLEQEVKHCFQCLWYILSSEPKPKEWTKEYIIKNYVN